MNTKFNFAYCLLYCFALLPIIGFLIGGYGWLLPAILLLVVVPLIDLFFSEQNSPSSAENIYDQWHVYVCLIFIPFFYGVIIVSMYLLTAFPPTTFGLIAFGTTTGLTCGALAINAAHELLHKTSKIERIAARFILGPMFYGQFYIEHIRSHHKNAATLEDPTTARLNESIYHFIPRSLVSGWRNAIILELDRLKKNELPIWHYKNELLWIIFSPLIALLVASYIAGMMGLAFFMIQALTSIIVVELVNYMGHYGLLRQKLDDGQYEPIGPQHSWSAPYVLSNRLLLNLQHHPDHHIRATERYPGLKFLQNAPQYPSGYPGMLFIVLIPPLWKSLMNKRILTRSNTQLNESKEPISKSSPPYS